jgi:hypothetical protein
MAKRQGVTDEQLENLKAIHEIKLELFRLMGIALAEYLRDGDATELKSGAHLLEQIEFALQRNWNFSEDTGMHEWYLAPGCRCPKMDNAERRFPNAPGSLRVINGDCPIHGWA